MAETSDDITVTEAPAQASGMASVADAVRVATEASLAPGVKPGFRREASASPFSRLIPPGVPAAAQDVPAPSAESLPPVTYQSTKETVMTTAEEMMSFQQGNFEAFVKSGQIWAAGLQDFGRSWAATMQAQMDETMGTVKAMTSVKSMREAVELQSTLARSSIDKVVSEGGKMTDASMKLAEQTLAPITARLSLAAERFGRTA